MNRRELISILILGTSGCASLDDRTGTTTPRIESVYLENHHHDGHEIAVSILEGEERIFSESVSFGPGKEETVPSTAIRPDLPEIERWTLKAAIDESREKTVSSNQVDRDRVDVLCRISKRGDLDIFTSDSDSAR